MSPARSRARRGAPLQERLDHYTDKSASPEGCWLWKGGRSHGYGVLFWQGRNCRAHRLAFEAANGSIPEGAHILHRCDTPLCVNPPPIADAIRKIKEHYAFGWSPDLTKPYEEVVQGPHTFSGGKLERDGNVIAISKLQFFNDGIIVTARNTDDSDAVLEDLIEWGTQTFGYRTPTTPPRRVISSSLIVDTDFDLDKLLNPFGKKLWKLFADHLAADRPLLPLWKVGSLRIAGVSSPDDLPEKATHFLFERRATAPFDKLRYFSDAPISTPAHIRFLEELEKLVASTAT